MPDLETRILIEAMQTYFLHRDLAISCQREFNSAQKAFVKGLLNNGHTRDEIREATANFTKASQKHDQLVVSVKEAARALQMAHSWYIRRSFLSKELESDHRSNGGSDAALSPPFSFW